MVAMKIGNKIDDVTVQRLDKAKFSPYKCRTKSGKASS
jgi:hypothetical protein